MKFKDLKVTKFKILMLAALSVAVPSAIYLRAQTLIEGRCEYDAQGNLITLHSCVEREFWDVSTANTTENYYRTIAAMSPSLMTAPEQTLLGQIQAANGNLDIINQAFQNALQYAIDTGDLTSAQQALTWYQSFLRPILERQHELTDPNNPNNIANLNTALQNGLAPTLTQLQTLLSQQSNPGYYGQPNQQYFTATPENVQKLAQIYLQLQALQGNQAAAQQLTQIGNTTFLGGLNVSDMAEGNFNILNLVQGVRALTNDASTGSAQASGATAIINSLGLDPNVARPLSAIAGLLFNNNNRSNQLGNSLGGIERGLPQLTGMISGILGQVGGNSNGGGGAVVGQLGGMFLQNLGRGGQGIPGATGQSIAIPAAVNTIQQALSGNVAGAVTSAAGLANNLTNGAANVPGAGSAAALAAGASGNPANPGGMGGGGCSAQSSGQPQGQKSGAGGAGANSGAGAGAGNGTTVQTPNPNETVREYLLREGGNTTPTDVDAMIESYELDGNARASTVFDVPATAPGAPAGQIDCREGKCNLRRSAPSSGNTAGGTPSASMAGRPGTSAPPCTTGTCPLTGGQSGGSSGGSNGGSTGGTSGGRTTAAQDTTINGGGSTGGSGGGNTRSNQIGNQVFQQVFQMIQQTSQNRNSSGGRTYDASGGLTPGSTMPVYQQSYSTTTLEAQLRTEFLRQMQNLEPVATPTGANAGGTVSLAPTGKFTVTPVDTSSPVITAPDGPDTNNPTLGPGIVIAPVEAEATTPTIPPVTGAGYNDFSPALGFRSDVQPNSAYENGLAQGAAFANGLTSTDFNNWAQRAYRYLEGDPTGLAAGAAAQATAARQAIMQSPAVKELLQQTLGGGKGGKGVPTNEQDGVQRQNIVQSRKDLDDIKKKQELQCDYFLGTGEGQFKGQQDRYYKSQYTDDPNTYKEETKTTKQSDEKVITQGKQSAIANWTKEINVHVTATMKKFNADLKKAGAPDTIQKAIDAASEAENKALADEDAAFIATLKKIEGTDELMKRLSSNAEGLDTLEIAVGSSAVLDRDTQLMRIAQYKMNKINRERAVQLARINSSGGFRDETKKGSSQNSQSSSESSSESSTQTSSSETTTTVVTRSGTGTGTGTTGTGTGSGTIAGTGGAGASDAEGDPDIVLPGSVRKEVLVNALDRTANQATVNTPTKEEKEAIDSELPKETQRKTNFGSEAVNPPAVSNNPAVNNSNTNTGNNNNNNWLNTLLGLGLSLFNNNGDTPTPAQPSVEPHLAMFTATSTVNGMLESGITWNAQGVTSCSFASDWVSFGDGTSATLTPAIIQNSGSTATPSGTMFIFHPHAFKVWATRVSNANGSAVTVQDQRASLSTRILRTYPAPGLTNKTVVLQETIYTPVIPRTITPGDTVVLHLDGQTMSVPLVQGDTAESVVAKFGLLSAQLPAGNPFRQIIQDKHMRFSAIGDKLTIDGDMIVAGQVPAGATYALSCTGEFAGGMQQSVGIGFGTDTITQ